MNKNFKISKVRRVLRLVDNGFEPATYFVYKVSGPRGFKKFFTLKKDIVKMAKMDGYSFFVKIAHISVSLMGGDFQGLVGVS